ncbi:MAG: hypothetical protein KDD82_10610 [Planctomycetes bacterium]|nr:hypothetical protein [Planctomycetota bacterium]
MRLLLVTLLGLAGCTAPGTDMEALPFFRVDRTTPGATSVDVPALLLNVDSREVPRRDHDPEDPPPDPPTETLTVVRFPWPFGQWVQRGEHHAYMLNLIVGGELGRNSGPVGRGLSSEEGVSDRLITPFGGEGVETGGLTGLPLFFYDHQVDHKDLPDLEGRALDRDVGLWPFFAYGSGDSEEDSYFALFPFGGTTRGLLGKEEITWYGFPLPAYMKIKDRAYTSIHYAFPFVNFVEGPHNQGFRIFPFYANYTRTNLRDEPVYERTFVMWPFYSHSRDGLDEPVPTESLFVFPFYGRITGPKYTNTTLLWPFFRYEDDAYRDWWELRAPFPFFTVGGGKDRARFDLWPLFGVKWRKDYARHFFVWPIWRYESLENERSEFSGQWLLPLFWRTYSLDKETGRERHKVRVYPLLHYRREKDTSVDISVLSPWYFDDANGFERVLGPFTRLYRYHRDADGGTEHQALLGLFSYRDLPAAPQRGEYSRLSLLFGLFQYRNLGGEKALRFLWLPEFPSWGGGS